MNSSSKSKSKSPLSSPIKAATLVANPAILELVLAPTTASLTNHEIADALLELQKLAGFNRNYLDLVLDKAITRLRACANPRKPKATMAENPVAKNFGVL